VAIDVARNLASRNSSLLMIQASRSKYPIGYQEMGNGKRCPLLFLSRRPQYNVGPTA